MIEDRRYSLDLVLVGSIPMWRLMIGHTGEVMECNDFTTLAARLIEAEVGQSALVELAQHAAAEITDLTDIAIEHEACGDVTLMSHPPA